LISLQTSNLVLVVDSCAGAMDPTAATPAEAGEKRELTEQQKAAPRKKQKVEKPGIELDISKCLKERDAEMAKHIVGRIMSGEKTGAGTMVQLMFLLCRMGLLGEAYRLYSRLRETGQCSMTCRSRPSVLRLSAPLVAFALRRVGHGRHGEGCCRPRRHRHGPRGVCARDVVGVGRQAPYPGACLQGITTASLHHRPV
jgi:hypothetical protein